LHLLASNPKNPKWADAIRQLAAAGDGFTLQHLKPLDAPELDPAQQELLKQTRDAISQRVAKEDARTFTKLIEIRLERAAWADLGCNPLEGTLVPWTRQLIRQHLDTPGVVAELERIQTGYVSTSEPKTLYSSMQDRVRQYAKQLLVK